MDCDVSQRSRVNIIARIRGPWGCRSTDVNLDVFVGGHCFGPVVPLAKVPAVGIIKLGERTVVVIYYRVSGTFVLGDI